MTKQDEELKAALAMFFTKRPRACPPLVERRIIRLAAGASPTQPIFIESGTAAPYWTGESYYWTTPSGRTRIRHPSAYRWPMQYHSSTLELHVGADWVAKKRTPAGMEWRSDAHGSYLRRASDGMDYHPTSSDLTAKDFARRVRRQMADNYKRRAAARREDRDLRKSIPTICVTLDDSRRAGNCVAGTLSWIERRLRLSRNDVLAAGYVAHVPAESVLAAANGDADAVRRAVIVADQRLSLVQI